jgi:uncharacterized protein (DUF885 family)
VAPPQPHAELARLSADFFQVQHSTDPFTATLLGVTGFDDRLPDPSRAGGAAGAARIAEIEERLGRIDASALGEADQINHAVLGTLARGARSDLEHGLWEANASAASYVSPQAMAFQSVHTASLADPDSVDGYLRRLAGLGGYFDAIAQRYRKAKRDGRLPTAVGVRQAIDQLTGHLAAGIEVDALMHPALPAGAARARAAGVIEAQVRPAMRRLLTTLCEELLPVARPDDRVGIRFVPGGEEGYRAAVRRHTTTELTPEEIHQLGLDCLDALAQEWAELGGRALGSTDVAETMRRLREDPALRFDRTEEIVAMVGAALHRAEEARADWFPAYDIPQCDIEEINPIEAGYAPLAYYRPPAAGGARPGAHCVLTADPRRRFTYEYEALAFHESVPGHHLQIASAQTLTGLPEYRRYLDGEVGAYVEGWGLYSERLADEMGLYTSDVARLGMLSFDALRACRLVVDTGMHHFGWSRARAVDFMWRHTATTEANVANEIDRYIAWPGQALGYMVGRREIGRLRAWAQRRLGARFDIRAFHGTVLGNGAVPLGVLQQIVLRWIDTVAEAAVHHGR